MDKAAKLILNSLRCPVCKSQIDMLGWQAVMKKSRQFNYCCVAEPEHYGFWFITWDPPLRIESEVVVVYDEHLQYEIKQQHFDQYGTPSLKTSIYIREVDPEHRVIENIESKVFTYEKCLFDFPNSSGEKIINRIKTILVFQ